MAHLAGLAIRFLISTSLARLWNQKPHVRSFFASQVSHSILFPRLNEVIPEVDGTCLMSGPGTQNEEEKQLQVASRIYPKPIQNGWPA